MCWSLFRNNGLISTIDSSAHLFTYLYLSFIFFQIFELFFHEYNENEQTTFTT